MRSVLLSVMAAVAVCSAAWAAELAYFQVHTPQEGMSADEIMSVEYFVKYTKFAKDVTLTGKAFFINKAGVVRERDTKRIRLTLGGEKDGIAYKDLTMFTSPQVKGLASLSWTYMDHTKEQDVWLWLPSLKKIRKVSSANADDSFLGSDFTVDDISTRRFEDETYTLLREEEFKGYVCAYDNTTYYAATPCFVIECVPKRSPWYYIKRILWVDKATGGGIYEEKYDASGTIFMTLFKKFEMHNVNGKAYPAQAILEGKNLRTGHRTVITNTTIEFEKGLSEDMFTQQALMRSRW